MEPPYNAIRIGRTACASIEQLAVSALIAALWAGCSSERQEGELTFVADVVGDNTSFDAFSLLSDKMAPRSGPRQFVAYRVPVEVGGPTFEVSSWQSDIRYGLAELKPFACLESPDELRRLLANRWTATETQQVFLGPNGTLELGTNFDHTLLYQCHLNSPSAGGMKEWGGYASAPLYCAGDDRKDTVLRLSGTMLGVRYDGKPRLCYAMLDGTEESASLVYTFVFEESDFVISLSVKLVKIIAAASLPIALEIPGEGVSVSLFVTRGTQYAGSTVGAGSWTIGEASFAKSGRTSGQLHLTLSGPDISVVVDGLVSVPLLQHSVTN